MDRCGMFLYLSFFYPSFLRKIQPVQAEVEKTAVLCIPKAGALSRCILLPARKAQIPEASFLPGTYLRSTGLSASQEKWQWWPCVKRVPAWLFKKFDKPTKIHEVACFRPWLFCFCMPSSSITGKGCLADSPTVSWTQILGLGVVFSIRAGFGASSRILGWGCLSSRGRRSLFKSNTYIVLLYSFTSMSLVFHEFSSHKKSRMYRKWQGNAEDD